MQTAGAYPNQVHDSHAGQDGAPKPKLLDQVRQAIRARHYSKRTEKTYVDWIKAIFNFPFSICNLSFVIEPAKP